MKERASLLEEIEKNTLSPMQTTDNECQTDDHQHEKLVQVNKKLNELINNPEFCLKLIKSVAKEFD